MDEYRTEVDGWLAEWRIDHHRIRIMLVCNGSDSKPLVCSTSAPDLAQMRELFPKLSRLWDAIRHEYWAEVFRLRDLTRADSFSERQAATTGADRPDVGQNSGTHHAGQTGGIPAGA